MLASDDETTDAILSIKRPARLWKSNRLFGVLIFILLIGIAGMVVAVVFGVILPDGGSASPVNHESNGESINIPLPIPDTSSTPSESPAGVATTTPTIKATENPTATPTIQATEIPTATPIIQVVENPTAAPTVQATANPTATPIATANPTVTPIAMANPTAIPIATASPTSTPIIPIATENPTSVWFPTVRPTFAPTTGAPTILVQTPSPTTSTKPSFRPTAVPILSSVQPSFTPIQSTNSSELPSFSFYAMGDIPYAVWETVVLKEQMANMTLNRTQNSIFTIHVGDLNRWQHSNCAEPYYSSVRDMLLTGPLPTFVLAGDNDSDDCPVPSQAWSFYRKYFISFEQSWTNRLPAGVPLLQVTRYAPRPELFTFVHNDVVFLSANFIDEYPADNDTVGLAEMEARIQDASDWVITNVQDQFAQRSVRGIVIFSHSVTDRGTRPFFDNIAPVIKEQGSDSLPVMYLHGHGHKFSIESSLTDSLDWPGFIEVQVDQGALADPLLIEIAPVVNGQMVPLISDNKRQHVLGEGFIRVDRQKGKYPERKK